MGASAWIKFAVAYHKKHGGSYSSALKKAGPLWRAQKAGKGSGKSAGDAAPEVKKKVKKRRRRKKT